MTILGSVMIGFLFGYLAGRAVAAYDAIVQEELEDKYRR